MNIQDISQWMNQKPVETEEEIKKVDDAVAKVFSYKARQNDAQK